jgi:hypothetical protein
MNTFRALVVDDDTDIRQRFDNEFRDDPQIKVKTTGTPDEAKRLIQTEFFHAAFIDLMLENNTKPEGKYLLAVLRDTRPSCARFLLNSVLDKSLFELLRIDGPLIHGILDKLHQDELDVEVLRRVAQRWLERPIEVAGLGDVYQKLKGPSKDGSARVTPEEIDYLASRIFGQGETYDTFLGKSRLEILTGGRSRSVVTLGRPVHRSGREGILTVIKFSELEEARQEYLRYCQHVRFMLSLNRRVELLGYYEADTLGAMCYSFAGESPKHVISLEKLIHDGQPIIQDYLRRLFSLESKEWLAQTSDKRFDQGRYFRESYGFDVRSILESVEEFARRICPAIGGHLGDDEIKCVNARIKLPEEKILAAGHLRDCPACVVHGDLNAANVIIAPGENGPETTRIMLIDYRHTGVGPAALDFAALEASLRVFSNLEAIRTETVEPLVRLESLAWKHGWAGDPSPSSQFNDLPLWAETSSLLIHLARNNLPELTQRQYAGTCLLWALRVFRVRQIGDDARLRLLLWISRLLEALR